MIIVLVLYGLDTQVLLIKSYKINISNKQMHIKITTFIFNIN